MTTNYLFARALRGHASLALTTLVTLSALSALTILGCGSSSSNNGGGTGGAASGSGGAATGSGGSASGSGGAEPGSGGAAGGSGGSAAGGSGGSVVTDAAADQSAADATTDATGDGATAAFQFKCDGLVMMGANLVFPPKHSAPMNISPPFSWGKGPAGTMSYVITMFDITASNPHWAIWDIPAAETGLATNLPRTAMPGPPAPAGCGQTGGFQGPGGPNVNMYELRLWALKVAKLPNPGNNVTQIRARLTADFMGPKTLVLDSQMIIARGTRGGIGMDPP